MTARPGEIVALYVIFGTDEEARRIGRDMVERRLAACVNILGACHSVYRWKDEVEEAGEVAAIFKTRLDRAEALTEAVRSQHGYEVPAIVTLPITTHPDYRDWLLENSTGS